MYLPHVPQAAQPETGPEEDLTKVLPDLPLQEALDQAAQAAQPAQPREPAAHSTQPRQAAVPPVPPTRNPRAVPPEEPEEEPVRRGVSGGILAAIVGGALVLLAVVIFFGYGLVLKGGDTIYPNVFVAGINVGGMTSEEAVAAVADAVAASYSSATLDVQLPDRTLSFTPDQTNVALDADEAIAEAMAYGRSGNPFSAVLNYFSCRSNERYIDLQTVLNLDTDYIRNRIDELAQEVETTLSPSKVDVNEAAGTITVQVGYPDRQLDTEGLYEAVYNAFMNSDFTTLTWDYQETPCELVDLTPYYEQYCTEVQNAEYDEETHTISEEVPGYGFDLEAAQQQLATAEPGSTVVIQMEDIEPEVTKLDLSSEMFGTALHKVSTKYARRRADRRQGLSPGYGLCLRRRQRVRAGRRRVPGGLVHLLLLPVPEPGAGPPGAPYVRGGLRGLRHGRHGLLGHHRLPVQEHPGLPHQDSGQHRRRHREHHLLGPRGAGLRGGNRL